MHVMNNQASLLNVTQVLLGETGTYNDVYMRPWETQMGDDEFQRIRGATEDFTKLSPGHLSSVAGSVLHPRAEPGSQVGIDHGWGEQRLRFMMRVTLDARFSTVEQVVTGYTDRADLSYNNELDPNTRFYVNNVITLRRTENRTANGIVARAVVSDNAQVLRDTTPMHNAVSLRPQDVVRSQHANVAMSALNELHEDDLGSQTVFHDARNAFNPAERVKLSKRKNALSTNYMSNILGAYRTATTENDDYSSEEGIYEMAQGRLSEGEARNNPLLNVLLQNTGFSESTSFTLYELRDLCPHVDKVMTLSRASGHAQALPNQRGQTETWDGKNNETLIANIVATTVPALALDHLLTKVWFTSTNETLDGQVYTELNHTNQNPPCSFTSGTDITRQIQAFIDNVTHYLMRDITHNNMLGVSLSVRYEALGDTFITVSCNGEPAVDYIIPTFCDSLFSPIVSDNNMDLQRLSGDFQTMLDYGGGFGAPGMPDWGAPGTQTMQRDNWNPTSNTAPANGWQANSANHNPGIATGAPSNNTWPSGGTGTGSPLF